MRSNDLLEYIRKQDVRNKHKLWRKEELLLFWIISAAFKTISLSDLLSSVSLSISCARISCLISKIDKPWILSYPTVYLNYSMIIQTRIEPSPFVATPR